MRCAGSGKVNKAQRGRIDAAGFDPLPSWSDRPAKAAIVHFVTQAVTKDSGGYIPPEDRAAVSDMDGTMLLENGGIANPGWIEIEMMRCMIEQRCGSESEQDRAARAAVRDYYDTTDRLLAVGRTMTPKERETYWSLYFRLAANALAGLTMEEACAMLGEQLEKEFVRGRSFRQAFYAPMLELYRYLRQNKFSFYVVSGSNRNAVYVLCREALAWEGEPYPYDHCIGADLVVVPDPVGHNRHQMVQSTMYVGYNMNEEKCVNIARQLGHTPVLAFGNSAGDTEMLDWTLSNDRHSSLSVLINHDDASRECANAAEELALLSQQHGWLCVSIRDDFARIF